MRSLNRIFANDMENNRILQKLDGLESRYEEVSTLITDPAVIADQQRYVKLTKEYKTWATSWMHAAATWPA